MINKSSLELFFKKLLKIAEIYYDEFNSIDGQLGDGDLGITISKGLNEINNNFEKFEEDLGKIFMVCAQSFTKASSSSFGTLVAISFMTVAKETKGTHELDIKNYKIFDFDCNQFNRVKNFFRIRSESHSFFYGLIKKENLMERLKNHPWKALANDWILNLELLFDGKFKTIPEGEISIGTSGISKIGDGKGYVEEKQELLTKIFPYRELFKRISKRIFNSTKLSLFNKICLIYICFKINIAYFVLYKLK